MKETPEIVEAALEKMSAQLLEGQADLPVSQELFAHLMHTVRHEVLGEAPVELAAERAVLLHLDHVDAWSCSPEAREVLDRIVRHHDAPLHGTTL